MPLVLLIFTPVCQNHITITLEIKIKQPHLRLIVTFIYQFRSVYNPYDPFLATSLAQLQAAAVANAASNHGGSPAMTDPRLQVRLYTE